MEHTAACDAWADMNGSDCTCHVDCPYCVERRRMNVEYNVQPPMGHCPLHESTES